MLSHTLLSNSHRSSESKAESIWGGNFSTGVRLLSDTRKLVARGSTGRTGF